MHHEVLAPGFTIAGKYVIERTLGRGGMGAVYVVSHANTGKRLALKVLLPEFVHNADIVGRFLREAQVMGRLQHRHVVDVFDVGRDGDVLYIVMELLEGKPLGDLLHDESLTLEEALLVMLRAMEGIAAAHDVGVIHRDIKPDNIFVCVGASGRLDDPRVLDFGISKLDDGVAEQLTRSGVAMGTPYYMSIEQLNGQRDLDARVDVYAVGVILYEAISGMPPYTADSISALAIRVLTTDPVHLRELRPDLPSGLAEVVMKAMAKQREARFRSMRQLIEALRPFVPRSAGVLVPEGQSRPLRTPGGAAAARTPLQPQSVVQSVRGSSRPATGAADEQGQPRASVWVRNAALVTVVLLITGIAAFFARQRWSAVEPLPAAPIGSGAPTIDVAPESDPERSRETPLERVRGGLEPEQRGELPRDEVRERPRGTPNDFEPTPNAAPSEQRIEPVQSSRPARVAEPGAGASPSVASPSVPSGKTRTTKKGRTPAATGANSGPAAATPAVVSPSSATPSAAPATERKSAEGRAGKLGSDEF